VIRRKSTDADKMSKSSEPASSTRRENINERVARLLATVPKLEFDNIDMEEYNIDMVEVLTYRKRPYCCVKRPETALKIYSSCRHLLIFVLSPTDIFLFCSKEFGLLSFLNSQPVCYECLASSD
jgi:hypothetical protein